jgi:hypothetical protein
MVSSTASSLIVLFIIASFLESISPAGESDMLGVSERDIFALQKRYYLAVRDSDIFAFGERGGKHATYKSSHPMRTQCAHVPKAHIALQAYRLPQGKYRKSVRIYIALVCLLRQTN